MKSALLSAESIISKWDRHWEERQLLPKSYTVFDILVVQKLAKKQKEAQIKLSKCSVMNNLICSPASVKIKSKHLDYIYVFMMIWPQSMLDYTMNPFQSTRFWQEGTETDFWVINVNNHLWTEKDSNA